jgi:putative endopeptidase
MPDRSYYLDESAPMAALRTKYVAHLATVLRLAGIADADAKAARVFAFEKRIAESHAKREDSEDIGKANNPWSRSDFVARPRGWTGMHSSERRGWGAKRPSSSGIRAP